MTTKKLLSRSAALILPILAICTARSIAQDQWIALGEASAGSAGSVLYIPAHSNQTVCSVRLNLKGGTLEVNELTVHFTNSQVLRIPTHAVVSSNSSTPSFNLPGDRRVVRGVEVVYKIRSTMGGRPTLDLWGNELLQQTTCSK